MNLSFAALYGLSALSLFGLAFLTLYLFDLGRSAWRRWRCRREMEAATLKYQMDGLRAQTRQLHDLIRRNELDGAATAQDKSARKIH